METFNEVFEICEAKISYTDIDKDFLIRYEDDESDRIVSARTLKELLDRRGSHFFPKFITRAYRDCDEAVCKLRSGVRVSFVLR